MHMQHFVKFRLFVLRILNGNDIPTSIKDQNSIINLQKLVLNNPNLDVVSINAYAKFGQIPSICSQDIKWKRNSDINQGALWKLTRNNPNLDLVYINAYATFG